MPLAFPPILARFVRSLPEREPGSPWGRRYVYDVGGLISVGFGLQSELLLVTSADGRGVFDCETGDRVARDSNIDESFEDHHTLKATGIGPLAGQLIPTAGLFGGGLPNCSRDGWIALTVWPDWLLGFGVLTEPGTSLVALASAGRRSSAITRLRTGPGELRAFGFSASGNTLVLATSADIAIYSRDRIRSG